MHICSSVSSQLVIILCIVCRSKERTLTKASQFKQSLIFSELSKAELAEENLQLKEQTREMRRKCAVIRDLIDVLQKNYESSKRLAFLHRYTVLKTMIKNIIHDNLV